MELRQLRYFLSLAEEMHFGRAAAREHIVQSALSQQIQRLEREVGVVLVDRSTHHVRLTGAGEAFAIEARLILNHVARAGAAVRDAAVDSRRLRVAVGDPSLDLMPRVLNRVQRGNPKLAIDRIEASVPDQFQMLADGTLDVGVGRCAYAPADVAAELFRLDRLGLLVADDHRLADARAVSTASLRDEQVLLAEPARAPEYNDFVIEWCRAGGFIPRVFAGTVQSVRAAAEVVRDCRCVAFVPESCELRLPGVKWRPLVDAAPRYPWSILWRNGHLTAEVQAVRSSARVIAADLGWLADGASATRRPIDGERLVPAR